MKRRVMVVALAAAMLFSLLIFPVQAEEYKMGDVDGDGEVTVRDVGVLRLYLADKVGADTLTMQAGDVDGDGEVTVRDVGMLRLYLADKITLEPVEKIDLSLYTIVYPAVYTKYEMYAAQLLQDYVQDTFDLNLPLSDDTAAETEYELLIGNTNRAASKADISYESGEYLLKAVEKQIILQGQGYMIGGAVGALTYQHLDDGQIILSDISEANVPAAYTPLPATGVILMIGDGMGYNHIKGAEFYWGFTDEDWDGFTAKELPNQGSVSTFCLKGNPLIEKVFQKTITDSAASATAMATGWKTYAAHLGVNYLGDALLNVREIADSLGYKTGILTTDEAFKATPAAFTVHNSSRYEYEQIQADQQALLDSGDLTYLRGEAGEALLEYTKEVLDTVSADSEGFFAMIEEAYIDIYSAPGIHFTDLLHAVARLDSAVEYAMTFAAARPDTVLIVTADHETGNVDEYGVIGNNGQHTMKDVPIFAMGAGTEIFHEQRIENNEIGQFIASVYGVEDFGGTYSNIAE